MRKTLCLSFITLLAAAPTAHAAVGDQIDGASGIKEKTRDHLARVQGDSTNGTDSSPAPKPKPVAVPAQLQAIAACESGGNPQAVSANGQYRGKYQFDTGTWQAVGGSGDPAAAPEAEQDRRAMQLYARSGAGQWPVCGQ